MDLDLIDSNVTETASCFSWTYKLRGFSHSDCKWDRMYLLHTSFSTSCFKFVPCTSIIKVRHYGVPILSSLYKPWLCLKKLSVRNLIGNKLTSGELQSDYSIVANLKVLISFYSFLMNLFPAISRRFVVLFAIPVVFFVLIHHIAKVKLIFLLPRIVFHDIM